MNKILFSLLFLFSIFNLISCDPENVIDATNNDSDTLDYVWDATKVNKIIFKNTTISSESKDVTINKTVLTINNSGTFEFSGNLSEGQIIVNAKGIVRLIFNNINLSNSTTSTLFVQQAKKTIIILPTGTTNTISDGTNYINNTDSLNAAIYSKDYLAFFGEGKLIVNGNFNNGISGKDELIIKSGNLEINSVNSGIKVNDYLKIYNGDITINSGGDGLKSENESLSTLGFIDIYNGNFKITSNSDAISASGSLKITGGLFKIISGGGCKGTKNTLSKKGIKAQEINISDGTFIIDSSDKCIDSDKNIFFNNGNFTLSSGEKSIECDSDFIINNSEINIIESEKGISGYNICLNGGKTNINSYEDCIKCARNTDTSEDDGSSININGGSVFLNTIEGNGIDSHSSLLISAATVVVQGSSNLMDEPIKFFSNFTLSDAILISSGGSVLLSPSSSSQYSIFARFSTIINAGIIINIQDSFANSIFSFKPAKATHAIFASLPSIQANSIYNLFLGGSIVGNDNNGLYFGNNYSNGTNWTSFKITDKTTYIVLN